MKQFIAVSFDGAITVRFEGSKKQGIKKDAESKERLLQRQRNHWLKLHTTEFTPEEFESWIASIPGCSTCQRDFRKLIETNPPRFDDWKRWTYEVHNAVNAKLGKPEITFEEASQQWRWNLTEKDFINGKTKDSS